MENAIFGKIVKTTRLTDGREVILRYPTEEDVEGMRNLINTLSTEDIYITFSGEQLTLEDEQAYFDQISKDMLSHNMIKLLATHDGKIVGNADVSRDRVGKRRTYHVASFGITLAKEFRGAGLGQELIHTIIEEAKKEIHGLRIIKLAVYAENLTAQTLYTKMGFKEFGRLKEGIWYRGRYIDEIEMYKEV